MRSFSLIAFLAVATAAQADLPSPRLYRVFPPGAAAGASVEVEIDGPDLDGAIALRFDHPGLTAAHVKDRKFKVTVAADVPAGTYDVRAVGRYGVSSPRLFAVSRGQAETVKKPGNYSPDAAQPVAVNTVVNGTTDGNLEDFYRFPATRGRRIVVDCRAQAIDSALDAMLTLTDADGRRLGSNGDTNGRDPLIDVVAPKDGEYVVAVADLSFRGGMPYRLVITDRPHVENVFPRAVRSGEPARVAVFGRNLGSHATPSAWRMNDLPLDESLVTVTPPDVFPTRDYRFVDHPTNHSVLPTAATCTLTGFQAVFELAGVSTSGVPVLVTDTPVTLEREPNDTPATAQKITLPAAVSGRFDRERDADWFEFEPPADGTYTFDVYCERIAGRADPYLVVTDDKDNRIAELDDFGQRVNAFDGHLRDPHGNVGLSAKRKYRVLVQDRYRRGGERYQYVLTIHKAVPDFYAAAIHHQNPGPGGTNVRRGGAAYLDVILHHTGGVAAPVTITAEGLPKGLHCGPTHIHTEDRGTVVLWADADAPGFVGPVRLVAAGEIDGKPTRREVRPYTRVNSTQNQASSRPTRDLVVAVLQEPAPFSLAFEKDRVEVEAGKKVELKLRCDRRWSDFKGPVTVIELAHPGPIQMRQASLPEGKEEVAITFEVQNGARPGPYTFAVQGQAQVRHAREGAKGNMNTLVALPSRPLTVVVVLPKKK